MGEKKKLRTKDLQEEFEEIKSNDDLDISLTISKSSSSAVSQVIEIAKPQEEEVKEQKTEETSIADEKKDTNEST